MQKPKKIAVLVWGAMLLCQISATGQQASCSPDVTPPDFDGPLDITIDCNSLTFPGITGTPSQLMDNCDDNPTVNFVDVINAGSCPNESIITRTWTATDSSGNVSTPYDQMITIRDQTAPSFITAAADTTLFCPDDPTAEAAFLDWLNVRGRAVAVDNCSAASNLSWFVAVPGSYDINNPGTFPGTAPGSLNPAVCPSGRPGAYRFETVDFVVVDECDNARKSTATFALSDTIKPQLSNCPTDTVLATDSGKCNTVFTFPVPQVDEGCGDSPTSVLFYYRINAGGLQLFDTLNPPSLTLVKGDYQIAYLATDCSGNTDSCSYLVTVKDQELPQITCRADSILYLNNLSCQINFQLAAPNFSDNCGDLTLQYSVDGEVQQTLVDWPGTTVSLDLPVGQTNVFFQVIDSSGLIDSCQYALTVIDSFPPELNCDTASVLVNPDGEIILTADLFDSGISDNCGIDSTWTIPAALNCSQIGDTVPVQVFVKDANGLIANCNSFVVVAAEDPSPSYNIGLCVDDTLFLMANPPAGNYNYLWSGPMGFSSVQQNPIIPFAGLDRMGSYVVQITGSSGCLAEASLDVVVTPRPTPPAISLSNDRLCLGDSITLSTPAVSGGQVLYNWYQGAPPNGMLIQSTLQSSLKVAPRNTTEYYVEVQVDNCISLPGLSAIATVITPPAAVTNDTALLVCEGSSITLGTNVFGPGITYSWTGPNGFMSNAQFPQVIDSATNINAGRYMLIVSREGCPSEPGETVVILRDRPAPASIAVSSAACEGDRMTLTASVTDGTLYTWRSPTFTQELTTGPVLALDPLEISDEGNWVVVVTKDGCTSLPSSSAFVDVHEKPEAFINSNSPVCSNDSVMLIANEVSGAQYLWRNPNNLMQVDRIARFPAIAGQYQLIVTSSEGCRNMATTQVSVNVAPQITALSQSGDDCGNGDSVKLVATIFPEDVNGVFNYEWSGPNGYSSNDIEALLPSGTIQDTGIYTLQVTDLNTCKSSVEEIYVDLLPVPIKPVIAGQQSICEGDTLLLSTTDYVGATISFEWQTPIGQFTTVEPELIIPNVGQTLTGTIILRVFVDGCYSENSDQFNLTIRPKPIPPNVSSNSPVCEGELIMLSTTPQANTIYEWIGPNNFGSDLMEPNIPNATPQMSGGYRLRITQDACTSDYSTPEFVQVKPLPAIPVVENDGPVCISTPGERIRLNIVDNTTSGAVYTWFDASVNQPIFGPSPVTSISIASLDTLAEGTQSYYVIATLNGCSSTASLPTVVTLNEIPLIPSNAGDDLLICQENMLRLSAEDPSIGYGRWLQLSGTSVDFADSLDNLTTISGLQTGTYELTWLLSNGACQDYAGDEVIITVSDTLDQAQAGDDLELCNVNEAVFNANAPAIGNYGIWEQTAAQQGRGITIIEPDNGQTLAEGFEPGNIYRFVWKVGNDACGIVDIDTFLVNVAENTAVTQTDPDFTDCGRGNVLLFAEDPVPGQGTWRSLNSGPSIVDPNVPETFVSGLSDGEYAFEWLVDNGDCGIARDTIIVTYHLSPLAQDDEVEVNYSGSTFFEITDNDLDADDATIEIVSQPIGGTLIELGNGLFSYEIRTNFSGSDVFTYQLCSTVCPDVCTEATVRIRVDDQVSCDVPTIFTPNNDGVNDAFIIPCLATGNYPENQVRIFNQWGDKVFEAAPYNNQWVGERQGQPLPSGTYYYLIDFGTGVQTQSGFLILER